MTTDNLAALHQIRIQLLYPEKHRKHVQSDILNKIANILRNCPMHICLYKVKSHAGVAGNECADAIAKHQASQTEINQLTLSSPTVILMVTPLLHDLPVAGLGKK